MKDFILPENAETYVNTVKDRCVDLISYKIWGGIKVIDLQRWFKNFEGEKEKYFAACVLDTLIYRSSEQVDAMALEIFTKKLPKILKSLGYGFDSYKCLLEKLRGGSIIDIRLVSVANKRERPTKSSTIILRGFRRNIGLNDNYFISPEEIRDEIRAGVKTFIFIDDFLGTGDQFYSMWTENGLAMLMKDVNAIYTPLVAHEKGIESLGERCPEVKISFAEYLPNCSNVFESAFNDNVNTPESAQNFYDELLNKYKFDESLGKDNKYGHGCLGLAYTFYHSSPDNCLHIIWDNKDGWHPLIPK